MHPKFLNLVTFFMEDVTTEVTSPLKCLFLNPISFSNMRSTVFLQSSVNSPSSSVDSGW